jgi:ArsR family transcriptional regulator
MLLLLDRHELTVSELCSVLQLPQSTVSRHLKTLADAAWVASRRDGTSRYYALALDAAGGPRTAIWDLTRGELLARAGSDINQDTRRLERVLARRTEASKQFFASTATQWDRMRDEMFGREAFPKALLSLLPSDWVVGDLGCGTGATLSMLAPHVKRVIGVDSSEEMLASAKARLDGAKNVELHRGTLEALPIDSRELDAAVLVLVLHHLPTPGDALIEAARTLKPGGRVLIVDMAPHEDEALRTKMGHVWLGLPDEQLRRWLKQAGFENVRIDSLPAAPDSSGPALFAAVGTKKR